MKDTKNLNSTGPLNYASTLDQIIDSRLYAMAIGRHPKAYSVGSPYNDKIHCRLRRVVLLETSRVLRQTQIMRILPYN